MLPDAKKNNSTQVFIGETKILGSGTIRTWTKTDSNNKPTSVGFTISSAALSALPANRDTMFMLKLPTTTGGGMMMNMMAMPFDHVEIDWSAKGDPNTTIFNHPHLDCHFFMISSSSQMNIMMGMDTTMLGANYTPQNCMSDNMAEEGMGEHWYDSTLAIYHGTAFNQTYMYGFYRGNITFVEVMCAKSYLDSKPNSSGAINQPSAFKTSGYYPTKYSISYDSKADEYTYSIDNMMSH